MWSDSEKEHCLKLTLAVYRVSELFPDEGENLKEQIRESANQILADLICNNSENTSRHIEILRECFEEVEAQDWVDSRNFLALYREYAKIEKLIKPRVLARAEPVEKSPSTKKRREIILEVLKGQKRIRITDLIRIFPQISKRTLIRDIEELYRSGKVVKMGNARASCYGIES